MSANTGRVVNFADFTSTPTVTSSGSPSIKVDVQQAHALSSMESRAPSNIAVLKPLTQEQLYPDLTESNSIIHQSNAALAKAKQELNSFLSEETFPNRSRCLMRSRAYLAQAFELKNMGDGFRAAVNGISCALSHHEEEPPSESQVALIISSLDELMLAPLLDFDASMEILDRLEEHSLDIEPPQFSEFLDLLDGPWMSDEQ
jgi:hypothetical protein